MKRSPVPQKHSSGWQAKERKPADIDGRLRSGLQVAPMVDGSNGGIDESAGKALGSFQEIALWGLFDVEGLSQDAFAELKHF